jgi:peptide/nickel transport system substrate-binding protein
LWPKNTDLKAKLGQQAVGVIDIGAGSIPGLDLADFAAHNEPALATEQLTLATSGVFAAEAARRAFALCIPRQRLYDQLGHPDYSRPAGLGAGVVNSRITAPDSLNYPAAAAEGVKIPGGDVAGAQAMLASGPRTFTVRIGYTGPDERRHATVAAMSEACNPAGITVIDSATAGFDPRALREGKVDAILGGPGSATGAPETSAGLTGRYALRAGSGANFGGYANARYDGAVDQLAIAADPGTVLNATADAERLLWTDVPTIPLFSQPRTIAFRKGLHNAVPSASAAGSGWNMDRWVLTR